MGANASALAKALTADDPEALEKVFRKYDANKTGTLDRKQTDKFLKDFVDVMRFQDGQECDAVTMAAKQAAWDGVKKADREQIVDSIESKKKGEITFEEFAAFVASPDAWRKCEEVSNAWNMRFANHLHTGISKGKKKGKSSEKPQGLVDHGDLDENEDNGVDFSSGMDMVDLDAEDGRGSVDCRRDLGRDGRGSIDCRRDMEDPNFRRSLDARSFMSNQPGLSMDPMDGRRSMQQLGERHTSAGRRTSFTGMPTKGFGSLVSRKKSTSNPEVEPLEF